MGHDRCLAVALQELDRAVPGRTVAGAVVVVAGGDEEPVGDALVEDIVGGAQELVPEEVEPGAVAAGDDAAATGSGRKGRTGPLWDEGWRGELDGAGVPVRRVRRRALLDAEVQAEGRLVEFGVRPGAD